VLNPIEAATIRSPSIVAADLGMSFSRAPTSTFVSVKTIHRRNAAARKNGSPNGGKSGMMHGKSVCASLEN
jgi:hypothetical protein